MSSTLILIVGLLAVVPDQRLADLVKEIIIEEVPLTFEQRKGWGDQVHIFDGFRGRGQGLKVRLEPKKKAVNHGLWQHYRINISEARQNLSIQIPRFEFVPGQGVAFQVEVKARLDGYADFKQYSNGVKLLSAATEAIIDVEAVLDGRLDIRMEGSGWVSDVVISPKVDSLTLRLPNIDVERFGKVRGKLAREAGDSFRTMLERKLKGEEADSVNKINASISKRWPNGELRLSIDDVLKNRRVGEIVSSLPQKVGP